MKYPNILYIHSHDTGRYIQPYGHAVATPHLQRLAEQGILFRQAFCAAPTCAPSRAALLTGQYAHNSGMIGLAHRGFVLNDYTQHILHTLRNVGYDSTLVGVQHLAKDSARIGYDRVLVQGSIAGHVSPDSSQRFQNAPAAGDVVDAAVDFLKNEPSQPFFLSVGFYETHREFAAPGPVDDPRYCLPPAPLPDTPETRQDMAAFKASARMLDHSIGTVLEALDAANLADQTLVICTTDHGPAFPAMKCNLTDHGMGVMLIMRGPGGFSGGRVCNALVSQIDLFPTICDLLEIEPPAWLQGQSMMPLIRADLEDINDEIFAEINYHAAYEPQRAVRTRRWKYIRRFEPSPGPVLPNVDDSLSKEVWLRHDWRERAIPTEQLYDLIFDPNEAHNLADDPSMATILEEMRGRLAHWMKTTADPLLRGPIVAPPGAEFNDPNGLSPSEPTSVAS